MIVVADASPLRYLILIEHVHVLPALYGRVVVPPAVVSELNCAVVGTLRVLADAAEHGFTDLRVALDRLRLTNFRADEQLIQRILAESEGM